MRTRATVRAVLLVAVAVVALGPGVARASTPMFELSSKGYELFAFGSADSISMVVTPKRGYLSLTAYTAKGTVAANRLRASFGRFGRISVRFHPSSNRTWERRHRRCHGRSRYVVRRGTFVGKVDFTGERGYIAVHARRVKGNVRDVAAKCKRSSSKRRELASITLPPPAAIDDPPFLTVSRREDVRATQFVTAGDRVFSIYGASAQESQGRVAIGRFALLFDTGGSPFEVNDALTFGKVSPAAPFRGTGTYRAGPNGAKSWTGSLRVDFPGAKGYSLTGPTFKPRVEKFPSSFFRFVSTLGYRLERNPGLRSSSPRWIESVFR